MSSHVPFEVIPEYQESWSFPLHGREFETGLLQRFDNDWLGGKELAEGYLAGIDYSLRSASGLFTRKLKGGEMLLTAVSGRAGCPRRPRAGHPRRAGCLHRLAV